MDLSCLAFFVESVEIDDDWIFRLVLTTGSSIGGLQFVATAGLTNLPLPNEGAAMHGTFSGPLLVVCDWEALWLGY